MEPQILVEVEAEETNKFQVEQEAQVWSLFVGLQIPHLLQAQRATHKFYTIMDSRFMSGLHQALLLFKE
jgi:hypothetical protein